MTQGLCFCLDGTGSDLGPSVLPHYEESGLEKKTGRLGWKLPLGKQEQVRRKGIPLRLEAVDISVTWGALDFQNWG